MSKKLRVLHAPITVLYQPWLYVEGLRHAGVEADYVCLNVQENDRWLMHSLDFDLRLDGSWPEADELATEIDFLLFAIRSYDVFHFHSGFGLVRDRPGLFRRLSDLALLKKLGKKIVMHWWGCDRRTEEMEAHDKYSSLAECTEETRKWCRTSEKGEVCEWADTYADVQLSNGDLCVIAGDPLV